MSALQDLVHGHGSLSFVGKKLGDQRGEWVGEGALEVDQYHVKVNGGGDPDFPL